MGSFKLEKSRRNSSIFKYNPLPNALSIPYQFPELPRESINVKEMEDVLDVFLDFLGDKPIEQYQNIVANIKTREWDLIIVQVKSIFCLDFQEGRSCIAILNEVNATMHQMASKNAQVIDNKYQPHKGEIVKFFYDPNKGSEAIYRGVRMLQEVIGITNIATLVHVKAFAQILLRICNCPLCIVFLYHSKKFDIFKELYQELIREELLALKPEDLPTIIKGQHAWNKIADCYTFNLSPVMKTYIEVEYQRRLSAKYFSEIL
ncbi:hypothetical protein F8M41_009443 [Gigaspora margarita]|uniref:Uncharacterized protein n=1 Tax=Gigaspora margarita TaxID=4874 RepID=A0A8H3X264_GIGMA|nr:hypothetical protein F8M41_009443 [Gigaspora margarita]